MSLLLALTGGGGGANYSLTALAGSYSLTGGAATLKVGRKITALAGAYSLTGGSAVLTKAAGATAYTLTALAGSYSLAGGTAALSWSGESAKSFSQEVEIKPRKWYVKRRKQIHVFDSAADADAFIQADDAAEKAIETAQKTSRRARKRARTRVIEANGIAPAQTVSIDWVAHLVSLYQLDFNIPALIAQQDYEMFLHVARMAQEIDDEEVLMLLM